MTRTCKGCGAPLQTTDKNQPGYTPKEEAEYCQRCFRLRHYGDVMMSMQQGLDPEKILEKINETEGVVIWTADLYNFEENIISRLNQKLPGKRIMLLLTKRDLLPESLTDEKVAEFIRRRLKEEGIEVDSIIMAGWFSTGFEESREAARAVRAAVDLFRDGENAIFMGVANAGKSTVLNRILGSEDLTISRHPGTTLDLVELPQAEGSYFDTPGLESPHSYLTLLPEKDLKQAIPALPVRPKTFQIREDQSFAVGGLVRLDVKCKGKGTVTAYFSRELEIHRGKLENADALWEKHLGGLLSPAMDTDWREMASFTAPRLARGQKMDVVIEGLGWFALSGDITSVKVYVHKGVYAVFRKAMI